MRSDLTASNSYNIKSFPSVLEEKDIKDTILEILFLKQKDINIEDKILAEIACKSSIKINHPLHEERDENNCAESI